MLGGWVKDAGLSSRRAWTPLEPAGGQQAPKEESAKLGSRHLRGQRAGVSAAAASNQSRNGEGGKRGGAGFWHELTHNPMLYAINFRQANKLVFIIDIDEFH